MRYKKEGSVEKVQILRDIITERPHTGNIFTHDHAHLPRFLLFSMYLSYDKTIFIHWLQLHLKWNFIEVWLLPSWINTIK